MELPKVYEGNVRDDINNSQEIFYGGLRSAKNSKKDILNKISDIFRSSNHVYKSKVLITLNSGEKIIDLVGKTSTELITLNGEKIKIVDILDIKKL